MVKYIFLFCFFFICGNMVAQNRADSTQTKDMSGVFDPYGVEQMPSFPGGMNAFRKYLAANMRYPTEAKEKKIQGRVLCTFFVEKNGIITNVRVKESVDSLLDAEAVRLIKAMPRWIPGTKWDGNAYTHARRGVVLPVTFKL